eukprot:scaffold1329_cov102-Isochrysis_galbana.AAC.1
MLSASAAASGAVVIPKSNEPPPRFTETSPAASCEREGDSVVGCSGGTRPAHLPRTWPASMRRGVIRHTLQGTLGGGGIRPVHRGQPESAAARAAGFPAVSRGPHFCSYAVGRATHFLLKLWGRGARPTCEEEYETGSASAERHCLYTDRLARALRAKVSASDAAIWSAHGASRVPAPMGTGR